MVIAATYFGVKLPRSVPFFDVRWPEDNPQPRSPWGETLWGGERAACALGLRRGWSSSDRHDRSAVSIQFYFDARDPRNAPETARIITALRSQLAAAWRQWRRAARSPADNGTGGSVHYRPAWIHLGNFGAGLGVDARHRRVVFFS